VIQLSNPLSTLDTSFADTARRFKDNIIKFDSRSEYACCALLEKYCSFFETTPGVNFQIQLGSRRVDFKIKDTFVEFHPTKLLFEFKNQDAWNLWKENIRRVEKHPRENLQEAIRKELATRYFRSRRLLLDATGHDKSNLIVVQDENEFIKKVLARFADKPLPRDRELTREFRQARGEAS